MYKKISDNVLNTFLKYTHDTELWSNYLPRVPRKVNYAGELGVLILAAAAILGNRAGSLVGILLWSAAVGLILLWVGAAYLVRWRSGRRAAAREQMVGAVPWRGNEAVLDVGCGTGVILNKAAQKLSSGTAIGIDIWKAHGGGGNYDLLMENARFEGVQEKIKFEQVNALEMPYPDQMFDVVFSSAAIHHMVNGHAEFDQLLGNLKRIIKPGGYLVVSDIAHMVEVLADRLGQAGWHCEVVEAVALLDQYEMKMVVAVKP